jgi:hypothetical protein
MQSRKKGSAEELLLVIVTDCDYKRVYKKVLINQPIQTPLLLVTPINAWQYYPRICLEELRKTYENSNCVVGVPAEIRTWHLRNKNQRHHHLSQLTQHTAMPYIMFVARAHYESHIIKEKAFQMIWEDLNEHARFKFCTKFFRQTNEGYTR